MSILRITIVVIGFLCLSLSDSDDISAIDYINKYRDIAIVEMYRSGVPASITLAQGLHESNHGKSDLALYANNHFGIKCKDDWYGSKYLHKDDDYNNRGELVRSCFRSYESELDSYVDHSNFLKSRKRYHELFYLPQTDYKAWAHGLRKCGYATDRRYAEKLISKIEKFNLSQYDSWINPLTK